MSIIKLLRRQRILLSGSVICAAIAATPALGAAPHIGTTSLVVADVDATSPEDRRRLALSDDVFRNEIVITGVRSASELILVDQTRITVGPNSRVVLDDFVYDPAPGAGALALRVTEGVFRFVSGNMASSNYAIETPSVTVGVRGTIIVGGINRETGEFGLILESANSEATVTAGNGSSAVLSGPGAAVVASAGGALTAGAPPKWLLDMIEEMDKVIALANLGSPPARGNQPPQTAAVDTLTGPAPVQDRKRGLPRAASNHDAGDLPDGLAKAIGGNGIARANHHATDPDGGPGRGNDKGKGKGRN